MLAETRHTRFWLCGRCCHLLHIDESGYGICEKTGRLKRCSESCDCGMTGQDRLKSGGLLPDENWIYL